MTLISNYQLLNKMYELAQKSQHQQSSLPSNTQVDSPRFDNLLSQSINQINSIQQEAQDLSTSYQLGADVSLAQVMVANQKSSLALTGAVTVRNKFVQAYQEIMNMPL